MSAEKPGSNEELSLREGTTDPNVVRRFYDTWSETYDSTLADWNYRAPEECADLIMPRLPLGARLLDVGCGTGLMGEVLHTRDEGMTLHGIDISAASLERARQRGVYATLTCHDLQVLPLPAEEDGYGGAVCVGVLTYLAEPDALLGDICHCVRPGGVIAFTQRSDMWESKNLPAMLKRLEQDGLWQVENVSGPRPYLPGNADFGDEIKVVHTVCRVVRAG